MEEVLKISRVVYVFQVLWIKKKSTFLPVNYSVPTILIELTNLFRIKSLNVKFSKCQKQSPEGVL